MKSKPFYYSKTYWANIIMAGAVILPEQYKPLAMSQEVQAIMFLVVNGILRAVTEDKVTLS
jgi:hypothetical protein